MVQTNAPLLIEDKLLEIAGDIEDVIEKFDAAFGAEPMRVLREKLPERTGLLPAEIDSIADQLQAPRHALTSDA